MKLTDLNFDAIAQAGINIISDHSLSYTPAWNLSTIPADIFASERARRVAAQRKTHAGGRPPVERPCPRCGAACPSAREARSHCQGKAL